MTRFKISMAGILLLFLATSLTVAFARETSTVTPTGDVDGTPIAEVNNSIDAAIRAGKVSSQESAVSQLSASAQPKGSTNRNAPNSEVGR